MHILVYNITIYIFYFKKNIFHRQILWISILIQILKMLNNVCVSNVYGAKLYKVIIIFMITFMITYIYDYSFDLMLTYINIFL